MSPRRAAGGHPPSTPLPLRPRPVEGKRSEASRANRTGRAPRARELCVRPPLLTPIRLARPPRAPRAPAYTETRFYVTSRRGYILTLHRVLRRC